MCVHVQTYTQVSIKHNTALADKYSLFVDIQGNQQFHVEDLHNYSITPHCDLSTCHQDLNMMSLHNCGELFPHGTLGSF